MHREMTQAQVMPDVETGLWGHPNEFERWLQVLLPGFVIPLQVDERFTRCQEAGGLFLGRTDMREVFLGQVQQGGIVLLITDDLACLLKQTSFVIRRGGMRIGLLPGVGSSRMLLQASLGLGEYLKQR